MSLVERRPTLARRLALVAALLVTALVYWPGLSGGYIFDDYPNIIENPALQVRHADWATLKAAALSSPSSEFHRPLSSLTFVANYMTTGLAPFGWKLTNLVIHLLNGVLVYLLARALLCAAARGREEPRAGLLAALIAAGWLLLPVNLTAVVYVVQRMESLANLFVLLGLLGYVRGRLRMQRDGRGFAGAAASLLVWTAIGLTAKETAVMTPFYAALIEWTLFAARSGRERRRDRRVPWLFALVLVLPGIAGLAWLLPDLAFNPVAWQARNFTLAERLLSEPRIWFDYLRWIVLPTPHALSFYHDEVAVSTGLLTPWTTLAAILGLALLVALIAFLRARAPLVALGLALFLGAQLLTGTFIPLELVYEQRNYFASFGVLLALLPLLFPARAGAPLPLARGVLLAGLLLIWTGETAQTAYAWSSPLRLAMELAERAPTSPRAQYELGRTYIVLSKYDPKSPFTARAYAPLERAMSLPDSSILPEQALIFMNSRMGRPLKPLWWERMIAHLKKYPPAVQDESSLAALTKCAIEGACPLPQGPMVAAFVAALSHPHPSALVMRVYADYALNVLHDRELALRVLTAANTIHPGDRDIRNTLLAVRALIASNRSAHVPAVATTPRPLAASSAVAASAR
ncbi:MAG: hypothetical protein KGJ50_11125 [Xanthomonadaceae bacterium]|nr:hypothetical protein [Xanthomonadaceae bacterium]